MPADRPWTRRRLLRTVGAVVSAAGLAGCSALTGGRDGSPTVSPAPVPTAATPARATPTSTPPSAVIELVDFAFEPGTVEPAVVPAGTTVRFVWVTQAHNIRVDAKPAASDWRGHEPIEDAGFTHEHRFDAPGRYEFHCEPHQSLGMLGTLVVEEG